MGGGEEGEGAMVEWSRNWPVQCEWRERGKGWWEGGGGGS